MTDKRLADSLAHAGFEREETWGGTMWWLRDPESASPYRAYVLVDDAGGIESARWSEEGWPGCWVADPTVLPEY